MSDATMSDAIPAAGAAIGEAISIFMLHPETSQEGLDAGYPDPFAAYFAGRAGVLGDANAETVNAVFAVFEPNVVKMCWETGTKVRGCRRVGRLLLGPARRLRPPAPERRAGAGSLCRAWGKGHCGRPRQRPAAVRRLAGHAAGRRRARARVSGDDGAARAARRRALLRAVAVRGERRSKPTCSTGAPNTRLSWAGSRPIPDGADKKDRYAATEELTNRRMAEIVGAALSDEEVDELARLSAAVLAALK